MSFPIPQPYTTNAADINRDEKKRRSSPPSFFFAQTHGLLLAAGYFKNSRLKSAHGGVAAKHRNRINGALFAQVMAAFEFCLKDFIASIIDLTDVFDDRINSASWINVDKSRILAQRDVAASVGAILIHPLLGWHEPEVVNDRFQSLFENPLIDDAAAPTLQRLWIIRHSVAHNAGFVTHQDAYRLRAATLREKAVAIDAAFLDESLDFLGEIVTKLSHDEPIGKSVMRQWIRSRSTGVWSNDKDAYTALRLLMTVETGRVRDLPKVTKGLYTADRKACEL